MAWRPNCSATRSQLSAAWCEAAWASRWQRWIGSESITARAPVEDLPDVLAMERARRVDLRRGFGQPELERHRVRGATRSRHTLSAGDELVNRALRDADERRCQIPSRQTPERRPIAEATVNLPPGHDVDAAALGIDGAVGGHERVLDDDVLAAAAPHARREPRVDDLVVRAREQKPQGLVGPRAGHRHHDPGGRVAAAREAPAPGDPESAARRLDLAAGGVQAAGEERVRTGGEKLLLAAFGKVPEPPVVRGPQRIAPGRRPAAAPELEPDIERRVHLDVVAPVAAWIADADQPRGQQIAHAFRRHLPELFRARRALLEDRHERGRPPEELVSRQGRRGDSGGGLTWAHGAPMLRRTARQGESGWLRKQPRSLGPGIASVAWPGGRRPRSGRENPARTPDAR